MEQSIDGCTSLSSLMEKYETCSHLLVYWPDEDSVTAVSTSAVRGYCTMTVGDQCKVVMNKMSKMVKCQ